VVFGLQTPFSSQGRRLDPQAKIGLCTVKNIPLTCPRAMYQFAREFPIKVLLLSSAGMWSGEGDGVSGCYETTRNVFVREDIVARD
jgi:hypothetical protein